MNPLVSIIIPNYNHSSFLKQRIESVINQSYDNFELILLDDASTDNSWEILQSYKSHKRVSYCLQNERNSGSPFKQWKIGIDLAVGDWIWIAESDDWAEYNFLDDLIKFSLMHSKCGLLYTQSIDVDENGKGVGSRIQWTQEFEPNIWEENWSMDGTDFVKKYLKIKNVIPNASAVIFNRALTSNVEWGKIINMRMCGDWFFWSILASQTCVGFCAEELNYFRTHIASSRNHFDLEKKRMRIKEEFIYRKYLNMEFKISLEKANNLQINWFSSGFSFGDLLKKEIYIVNIYPTYFRFFINFFKFKFSGLL